ncbi:MAG: RasGEF domain-containing protein, partial [archaeon]|nr:RasGEF domain-containing protein [archaeon]
PPPPPPLPPLPSAPLSAPSSSSPSSSPRDTKESISSPELDCSSNSSAPTNSSHLSTESPHSASPNNASPNNASPNIPPVIPFDLNLTRTRRDSSPASKQDRSVLARGSNSPQPSRRQRGGSTSGSSPGETLSAAPRSPAAARRDRPRCESIPGPEPSLATIPSSLSAGCIADADKIGRFRTPPPEHSHQQVHPRSGAGSVSLSRTTGASSLNLIPKSRSSIPSAEAFGVELSPIQVAHGLSVHALAMFLAVDTREFLDYGFGSKQFGSETISRSVSYFNLVSNWVSTKILASPVVETRVATIRGFISVAHQLFKLNNFHLLTAVYAGLESSPIVRLKQTWAGISEKNRSRLKAIGEVLSALKNYSKYREVVSKLRANRQSCLPYLGIYLRDLTFIHEGNATMVNDLINYPKVQFVAALLSEFEYFRKRPIRVSKEATHHSHHSFLLDLPDTCSDPEALYQKSLLAEPRDSVVPILDLNPSTLDPLPTNDVVMPSSCSLTSSSSFSSFSSSSAQSEEPSTSAEPPFDLASLPTLDPALLTRYHLEQAFFGLQKQNTELRLRIRQLESPN